MNTGCGNDPEEVEQGAWAREEPLGSLLPLQIIFRLALGIEDR